jgi:hypothetical protein
MSASRYSRARGRWIASHGWWLAQTCGRWIEWDDYGLHADAPVGSVWLVESR